MKYALTVGIPAKNEEANIYSALESVGRAVVFCKEKNYIIVICANGCTDNTETEVRCFIQKHPQIKCRLIGSRPGLVNAQREIVKKFPADTFVFPDADGSIAIDSIKLLTKELKTNRQLAVAYAKTISLAKSGRQLTLAGKIGLLYDSQKMLTPRHYFHGRLFATRQWFVPENKTVLKRSLNSLSNKEMLKYCRNGILLSADDIFMSSFFMDQYGLQAIKQVDAAHCYSWPVSSFVDWLNVYRRRNVEMEKMRRWFPEYNYLWPYLNRHTDWQKWRQSAPSDQSVWLAYLLMRSVFWVYLKLEFILLKIGIYEPPTQWKATTSTKKKN